MGNIYNRFEAESWFQNSSGVVIDLFFCGLKTLGLLLEKVPLGFACVNSLKAILSTVMQNLQDQNSLLVNSPCYVAGRQLGEGVAGGKGE